MTASSNELLITMCQGREISAVYNNGKMTSVSLIDTHSSFDIGNIYVGRIDNIVNNINAAFVNISDKMSCYLDLNTDELPLFVKRQSERKICVGDEIVVQLVKEGIKTKAPVVTTAFSIAGKYVSVVRHGTGVQISKKITGKATREHIKEVLSGVSSEDKCVIARTNSVCASDEEIISEAQKLIERFDDIVKTSAHAGRYTVLYKELPAYLMQLRDTNTFMFDRIVTDIPSVHAEVTEYLKLFPTVSESGTFTKAELVPDRDRLNAVYKPDKYMDIIQRRIINLKSGASIIIDQCEALTAIDVNSGKAVSGKRATQATFFDINVEAAKEIAYQLRLRNISGIIIIDFINQTDGDLRSKLLEELKNAIKTDPIQTELVDITKLGLVELTRKKVHKSVIEQLKK